MARGLELGLGQVCGSAMEENLDIAIDPVSSPTHRCLFLSPNLCVSESALFPSAATDFERAICLRLSRIDVHLICNSRRRLRRCEAPIYCRCRR
ncbi:hypothetical protein SDJN02_21958, partial [Cucurbita argyrosperma subsp. argyrosperma]